MRKTINYLRLLLKGLRTGEEGVTAVEYAIMLVLVSLAVAVFGAGLNGSIMGVFSRMVSALSSAS